jgi:hypothetical protein
MSRSPGRPPKPAGEKAKRRTITLPRRLDDAVLLLQQGDEGYSETIARLLEGNPAVSALKLPPKT